MHRLLTTTDLRGPRLTWVGPGMIRGDYQSLFHYAQTQEMEPVPIESDKRPTLSDQRQLAEAGNRPTKMPRAR